MAVLRLYDQHGQLQTVFPLDRDLVQIGRDPQLDVALLDPGVSRVHARIVSDKGRHRVEDLGSRNGSILNDVPLKSGKSTLLRDGDRIQIGRHRLEYLAGDRGLPVRSTEVDPRWKALRRGAGDEPLSSSFVLGCSTAMRQLAERVQAVARTNAAVLLLGESGTGKTVVAREIHRLSQRNEGPFVKVNCTALPESLVESELFGYAPNSGIHNADPKGKPGRFELAQGGTLFLDEIGDMPLSQQAKILDVIEDKTIQRIGGSRAVNVDVRVVSATARDLKTAIRAGAFREDLWHRLSRIVLELPPLRARLEDIPALSASALERLEAEIGKRPAGISGAAMDCLLAYEWPGNVRELENVLASAMLQCPEGRSIEPAHLIESVGRVEPVTARARVTLPPQDPQLSEMERTKRDKLVEAIEQTGSLTKAAKKVGMSKQWVLQLARKYGLQVEKLPPMSRGSKRQK